MRFKMLLGLALGCFVAAAPSVRADVWDTQGDPDNGFGTDNQLFHGLEQVHDFNFVIPAEGQDLDHYWVALPTQTSLDTVIDGISGDADPLVMYTYEYFGGATYTYATAVDGNPNALSVRLDSASDPYIMGYLIVASGGCTSDCGADDTYQIRSYDSTYSIPRFNNSATQITILQVQNTTDDAVTANVFFFSAAGTTTPIATTQLIIPARGLAVLNTSTVPGASGVSGSITISNDGRYGGLTGKAVALEPATGFTFDTPMVSRPL